MNKPALWAKGNAPARSFADDLATEYEVELGRMSGRCLDIGSGPCDVSVDYIFSKIDPKATFVCSDISQEMVEFGREKYKGNPRLSFMKLDIETPNLPKDLIGQFDHLTSFHCIHFCQNVRQVFQNFYNLLRPGGTMLLTFIANHPGLDCYKELAAMPRYQPYMRDADRWLPPFQYAKEPLKILKPLIEETGFEVHHCTLREKTYPFHDLEVFDSIVVAANPFMDRMPADLQKEYEKDLIKSFAEHCIIFNKNNDKEREYSVLFLVRTFVIYVTKPLTKKNAN